MAQVQGLNPSVLVSPDYQTQQMQAQRQLDLANALRQQALTDTPGNGGQVSWTQGLARVLSAFASKKLGKDATQQMQGANRAYAQGMARMFGGAPPQQPSAAQPSPTPAPTPQSAPADAQPQATPAAMPQGGQMPPQDPQQPQAPQRGPMSLTGDPSRDMALYVANPDEYTKQLATLAAAGQAPTDTETAINHAREALNRGDTGTAMALLGKITKDNYIAPVNGRPGSTIRDPLHPEHIIGYDAPTVEGALPTYDERGMPTGYRVAPGAAEAVAGMAGAKAGASAAATAPYEVIQGFDPSTGAPTWQPKAAVTGGTLNGIYHRGGGALPAGPAIGATAAANTAGTNSANQFNDAISGGSQAKQAGFQLDRIMKAAQGLSTGPGASGMSSLKSGVNAIAGAVGAGPVFNRDQIAQFDEIKKNAAALGLSLSQGTGQQSTDARLKTALDALPNDRYSPKAIQEVATNLKGLQAGALARAQAASTWQQQHGPGSFAEFSQTWNKAYNPEIFYQMQRGVPAFQQWAKGLHGPQRAQILDQYRQLKSLGAF